MSNRVVGALRILTSRRGPAQEFYDDDKAQNETRAETLIGWRQISQFLGELESVVHRWKKQGMPVHRQGRNVIATADEINPWLSADSGEPLHVAAEDTDLTSEMKRALSFVRQRKVSR